MTWNILFYFFLILTIIFAIITLYAIIEWLLDYVGLNGSPWEYELCNFPIGALVLVICNIDITYLFYYLSNQR